MNQLKKTRSASLVGAALVGLVHFSARAETAPWQTGSQGATISGDNNQVIQVINQTIINRPGRGIIRSSENNKKKKQGGYAFGREFEERNNPKKNRGHEDND